MSYKPGNFSFFRCFIWKPVKASGLNTELWKQLLWEEQIFVIQEKFWKSSEVNTFYCLDELTVYWCKSACEEEVVPSKPTPLQQQQSPPDTFSIYILQPSKLLFRQMTGKLINLVCTTLGKNCCPSQGSLIGLHGKSSFFSELCIIWNTSAQTHSLDCWMLSWYSSVTSLKGRNIDSSLFFMRRI